MRKPVFTTDSKEFVLDVTRSFAYEALCQPKKVGNSRTSAQSITMSKKLKGALNKLLTALNHA